MIGFTQNDNKKYTQAISWLIDSANTFKRHFSMFPSTNSDSSCLFEICTTIQYLGRPNLMKDRYTSIDSSLLTITKAELKDSRSFYKKFYFESYNLDLENFCKNREADCKLILSKPFRNILTVWLAPKYAVFDCKRPKFGKVVVITFVYDINDEILDYAVSYIIIN